MHDSSIFGIRLDFEKSKGSYIYDKNTRRSYLDFFGLYASSALGFNHKTFSDPEFQKEFRRIAPIKVPNCEIITDEAQSFLKEFSGHKDMRGFKYFHFCCTGALAIETAIKIALDQKGSTRAKILSFKESFHGINSYGGFTTDRFPPVSTRLSGFPKMTGWKKLNTPKIVYRNNSIDSKATQKSLERFKKELEACVKTYGRENIAALLVEPIQATYGDSFYPKEFFRYVRSFCTKNKICLIFDEIQVGFATTGKMWYFQHTGIEPDIVTFGKKTQVSGVMVKKNFDKIFQTPVRLEVTWDGDLLDMVRCKYILRAYQKYNILKNVNERSRQLFEGLKGIPQLKNLRGQGLIIAFDFDTKEQRDNFFKKAIRNGFICNRTRTHTVRLRPNLNVNSKEVNEALDIIKKSLN